ncbi:MULTISPECIES: glycosyltransferase family 39 protein [unclassified Achromobacter]|uniref:ArnT family glycosyltransferase n=1 Tax=unclassified Achromobacter TaxID=2626865 RepID=UPI000B51A505|nr:MULTISPECIES: glycosyltransferase family 39 protein [unclassified Achromobacter]OWT75390.1 dolichyl-phosphate-mannose--protein mannosyltransferase [Achromobacter sp. HZ28]OWT76050.1 dolichyl-phosphate-mannose--protein mannosyltransferase [Achromobacter sp. HZ34]
MTSTGTGAWRRLLTAPPRAVIFFGSGAWLLWLSWLRPLTLPDEGRYGGVAWEMLSRGAHVVPTLNGMPFFHKPPLYYWLAEAAYSVFGPSVWAARLPSLLAAWGVAMALYFFLRRWRGEGTALIGLLALLTQPFFYGSAQYANLDMLVAALIGMTILAGATAVLRADAGQPYHTLSVSAGLLAGLAVLAKGLIGVVLPGAVLVLWIILRRRWRGLAVLLWPPVIVVFLAVALPWFWVMQQRFPDFLHYFFVYQQFERFTETGFNNMQPFWFYVPVMLGLALPWTLWLGGALRKAFWGNPVAARTAADDNSQAANPQAVRAADVRWLMLCWLLVILVFFSIPASKLVGYIQPVLPALAALVAEVIVVAMMRADKRSDRRTRAFALTLSSAAVMCVVANLLATHYAKPNNVGIGLQARPEFRPGDTLIALRYFPYDLPMTLRSRNAVWVVEDWNRPDIAKRDNWRKELYDAGQFDQAAMREALISEAEMQRRMCAAPDGQGFWIWADPSESSDRDKILQGQTPRYAARKGALWYVEIGDTFKRQHCAGTPTNG